ncbi:MAG TPA: type II toxin-antitoxin system VapC family toxin [Acetobacteraceae bacterium]|nr:type II toxin-antitoxin system VapC family toxin [Acetobacteraceae bacterium]
MILLLDTHVFLWWDSNHAALPAEAKALIADGTNRVLVSAGCVWEIAIKRRLGKLRFAGSPASAIAANGFEELPILPLDAEQASELAWTHADPFDRLLVAQATRLAATLVTADEAIRDYGRVALLWAGAKER